MENIGPWCDWMGERLVGMRDEAPAWTARLAAIAPLATAECDAAGIAPPWDEIDGDLGVGVLAWNLASAGAAALVDRRTP